MVTDVVRLVVTEVVIVVVGVLSAQSTKVPSTYEFIAAFKEAAAASQSCSVEPPSTCPPTPHDNESIGVPIRLVITRLTLAAWDAQSVLLPAFPRSTGLLEPPGSSQTIFTGVPLQLLVRRLINRRSFAQPLRSELCAMK